MRIMDASGTVFPMSGVSAWLLARRMPSLTLTVVVPTLMATLNLVLPYKPRGHFTTMATTRSGAQYSSIAGDRVKIKPVHRRRMAMALLAP